MQDEIEVTIKSRLKVVRRQEFGGVLTLTIDVDGDERLNTHLLRMLMRRSSVVLWLREQMRDFIEDRLAVNGPLGWPPNVHLPHSWMQVSLVQPGGHSILFQLFAATNVEQALKHASELTIKVR